MPHRSPGPLRPRAALAAGRGVLAEATHTAAVAGRWLRGFGPEHVRLPAAGSLRTTTLPVTPVMLVHGLGANKSYFAALERRLAAAGYTVYCGNYRWLDVSLADCGTRVAADAGRFLAETGADRLHLVAHSLGGLVVRWALTHTDLAARAASVVTLGTPHGGSPLARLAAPVLPPLGTLLGQLRADAAELAALAGPATLPQLPMLAVGGGLDWVVPAGRALLPQAANATNLVVPDAGHLAMAAHRGVIAAVLAALAAAEPPAGPRAG